MTSCVAVTGSFQSIAADNQLSIAVDDVALNLSSKTVGSTLLRLSRRPSSLHFHISNYLHNHVRLFVVLYACTSQCLLFTEMYVPPSLLVYLHSNITRYILVSRYILYSIHSVYCSLRYTFSCLVSRLLRSALNRGMGFHTCPPKGIFSHFIIILLSICYRISLSTKTTHDGYVFVFVVSDWQG